MARYGKKAAVAAQIAATYIGTVVGAGFASGREILQFFTVHGQAGVLGILLSMVLFMWIGTKMMRLARRIDAYSYQEMNNHLFGKTLGSGVNIVILLILLGVTSVMLSGTGSIFQEQLGFSALLGILLTLVLCYVVMVKGLKGILVVNSLVVPMMLFFSIVTVIYVLFGGGGPEGHGFGGYGADGHGNAGGAMGEWQWQWVMSPFLYAAFNLAMAQAVLVPLGKETDGESMLKWGGILGGLGLGFMLLTAHFSMTPLMPDIQRFDIPMAEVIREIGQWGHVMFLLVVYGEIFTTLIGNVFGIARQIEVLFPRFQERHLILAILVVSFMISQAGFGPLVSYLYPLFGYVGLLLLFRLIFLGTSRS